MRAALSADPAPTSEDHNVPPEVPTEDPPSIVVIGAGPAGLTAAYELTRRALPVTVLEASDAVGGISQTVVRDGWRFDLGGHRFFTRVPEVEAFWHEILTDEEFLLRPRMSRIFYDGKLFDYPLKAVNALRGLGIVEAVRCVLSYLWAQVRPPANQDSFEGWVAARFGWRLYRIFFKTYTEKVWGIPANEIKADWAAQRIKNLSLKNAVLNALKPRRFREDVTSLIEEFQYPAHGPGMMWERCRDLVVDKGGEVAMNSPLVAVHREGGRAVAVSTAIDGTSAQRRVPAEDVISSMPLAELVLAMDPPAPDAIQAAAQALNYRDYLTVALVVPEANGFPDNWIYVHNPGVRLGRIQNYGSWSPYLVKDGRTCLGLEYFVNAGDELWGSTDADLIELGKRELLALGLIKPGDVQAGYVVRVPKAYPVYDDAFKAAQPVIRDWLAEAVPNVHPVGRNGMHKYNNQDHSMYTAMLTVENIADGARHDIWSVNVEAQYHEERAAPQRLAPVDEAPVVEAPTTIRLDPGPVSSGPISSAPAYVRDPVA